MTGPLRPELEVAALSGEVDSVMRAIVDRLMQLPFADGASLSTIDDEFAYFRVCAGEDDALQGRIYRLEETLGLACVEARDIVVLRSTNSPEVDRCLTPGASSIMLAPLEWEGKIRGILGVRSAASADAFDEADVEHIQMLAAGASIALRNAEVIETLAASERHYRELHDNAADAILVSDAHGNLLDANEAAAAMLGYDVGDLRRMHASALFSVEELSAVPPRRIELQRDGELRSERPFLRKDGTQIMVEYSCSVLDDGRVHTAMRDVTQRKEHEERLRSNLGRLHAIIETQQEISALELDPDAVTSALVQRAQRLAGGDGAAVQWFEGHESVFHHASGIAAQHVGLRLDRAASLAGVAARTGEAVYSADTRDDARVDTDATDRLGARSLICAPLYRDGRVEGVLSVMARRTGAFDELAIETTRVMAEFVSTIMRNATELETRQCLVEQLRMQEQVVEHMQTGLWVWKLEGDDLQLQYGNQAGARATNVRVEELVGKSIREVMPGIPAELESRLRAVIDTGEVFDGGEIQYGDSRIQPGVYSLKAFPLSDDRVAVAFDNVTEMTRSRRALQESEERFRGAFDSSAVGMALTALDGSFVQVNESFAQMLGYTTDELMRKGVAGITHRDDHPVDLVMFEELRTGARSRYAREKRYVRKDGSTLWGYVSAALVRSFDGKPAHIVSHIQDVTKQREAARLFESTFERSVVPKFVFDDARRLVSLNQAGGALLGRSRDAAIGMTVDELLPDEPVAEMWPAFLRTGAYEGEAWLGVSNGRRRRVEFVATANIEPGRHIAVVRDLTRQKELEAQLRQAQKMEAVGRLAGGIAHDFNNLLTAITGYSEFLLAGEEDERLRRYAEEIKRAAARAAALTGQLLAFSRRQVLQPRVLDLNAVVSDMDMMLRRLIGEDVELVAMLAPDLSSVQADPTQIEQVIVNLAVNARDAMPNGGSVTIETSNVVFGRDAWVELRMTDTGVGMTEEERQQLFDPFFTTKAGGTGLGLATVYGIVEQSGGTIEVDTSPGLGSSFRILLPAVQLEPDAPEPAAGDSPARGAETILLVEDELVVRQLVAEILESAGYTVLQAADGPSALELLRRHSGVVELLVTDVVMPGMSGPDVAAAVTAMRPGTEVLYISGYTDQAIGHHGVLEPGIAFLQKPFSADDLARKVRAVLDGASVSVD